MEIIYDCHINKIENCTTYISNLSENYYTTYSLDPTKIVWSSTKSVNYNEI